MSNEIIEQTSTVTFVGMHYGLSTKLEKHTFTPAIQRSE